MQPPTHLAISLDRPAGGNFSHFAHFVSDFLIPFFSLLRRTQREEYLVKGTPLSIELEDKFHFRIGPLFSVVREIFPNIQVDYVNKFTQPPLRLRRRPWENSPEDIENFVDYLKNVLPLTPQKCGVVIVKRVLNREKYPVRGQFLTSGADRRLIETGFEKLVQRVMERRPDTVIVALETLTFAEQFSLFMQADTLIAQHGAAFVHGHWMPKGGHLIELHCANRRLSPTMVPTIARLRTHKASVVYYPCALREGCLRMRIGDATKVSRLLKMDSVSIQLPDAGKII